MRLVVIGGVAAGLSAASSARRADPSAEITVFEKGGSISYSACGLPYYVEGRVPSLSDLNVYTPEYFERERRIAIRTSAEVVSISHARRRVVLSGGRQERYDKLVIATGASCRAAIAGSDQPHVFSLNTPAQALRLREHLRSRQPGRAAIVGGGYIGLEAAEALRSHGWQVTVVDANSCLLDRDDAQLTERLKKHLALFGVELVLGERIASIASDRVGSIPCDLAVIAAGLRPNTALAAEAGVHLGSTGAIQTNERMETNLHGVYACGDCAEAHHLVTGRAAWIPLGTTKWGVSRASAPPGAVNDSLESLAPRSCASVGWASDLPASRRHRRGVKDSIRFQPASRAATRRATFAAGPLWSN
jgi:NADPH-dependent 2,4-dienoyl-CoA reductase/sulfur reductase-like enzyme